MDRPLIPPLLPDDPLNIPLEALEELEQHGDETNLHQDDHDHPESSESSRTDDDIDLEDDSEHSVPPLGPHDPGRMTLGSTEKDYAKAIKAAVEADPELDSLSDFMYAQLAIVSLQENNLVEDLPAVLERIAALQDLRREYFVRDTLSHGREVMSRVIHDLLPGWFISFSYLQENGAYLRVVSLCKFNMQLFADPLKVRTWLAAVYYINHAHVPDFEAARRGFVQFIECKGYDWRNQNMFHIKAFTEAAPSFALYPIVCQQTTHYHTGLFVKLLASTAKRLLPKHMTKNFEFESGCEFGRLDEIFALPNPKMANQRLLARLEEALQRRYDNEASFQL